MIEFIKMFQSLRGYKSFSYEECGRTEKGRVYVVYGETRDTGRREKVGEFVCNLDEKICQAKVNHAIKKLNASFRLRRKP